MKKHKVVPQMKGQDKTPEKQLNGDKQSFKKRIQNNNNEDDSGSWKKMQEMFTKNLEELKNREK